jgi:NADPH:quinone reductase-like Zn-dependent oxidoreductase
MRAAVIDRFGGPEVLRIADVPAPEPQPGQVRIHVAYAGVNPADWKGREGWLAKIEGPDYKFPHVMGFDCAGIVSKLGPGVSRFKIGDRVLGWAHQVGRNWGSHAEYVCLPEDNPGRVPDGLDLAVAASIPIAGLTALQAVRDADRAAAGPGRRILIHGAGGGVGSFAVGFARMLGAKVAATCGTRNLEYVRELGAEHVIDYRRDDIHSALRAWSPDGVDAIVDIVGLGTLPHPLDLLKPGGIDVRIITLDESDAAGPSEQEAAARGLRATVVAMYQSSNDLKLIAEAIRRSKIKAPHIEVLPLADIAEAHRRLEDGHTRGKIVLEIAGDLR